MSTIDRGTRLGGVAQFCTKLIDGHISSADCNLVLKFEYVGRGSEPLSNRRRRSESVVRAANGRGVG